MSNPFTYCELHTLDHDKAKGFYQRLFDWKLEDLKTPSGSYTEVGPGEGIPGGMLKAQGPASHWLVYVKVKDLASATKKAKDLGAKAIQEMKEVPEQGSFSVLTDPTGAVFGLWEPKDKTK